MKKVKQHSERMTKNGRKAYNLYMKEYMRKHYIPSLKHGGGSGWVRSNGSIRWNKNS